MQTANEPSNPRPQAEKVGKAPPPIFGAVATAICAVLGIVGAVFHGIDGSAAQVWSVAACVGAYLAGGIAPAINASTSLRKGQLNVDLLMIVAAIGAGPARINRKTGRSGAFA